MKDFRIAGECDTAFSALAQAFEENFRSHGDVGASVCVYRDGAKVVDLWGGYADGARDRLWEENTLVNVWSTTKGMMALCIARLNDQGVFANDRPVADYWPEFGENGKEAVTVAQLFSHQAGLCGPSRQLSEEEIFDTNTLARILAAEAPHWPVGSRSGYHALSIGPLADGLVKHVTGKTVGQYFRDEIGKPLDVDFHMGLPLEEEGRVAEILSDGNAPYGGLAHFNKFQYIALENIRARPEFANLRAWRSQGMPSAGGQGNARSIASVYGALAADRRINGVELLSRKALDEATTVQIENEDLVLGVSVTWGIGFALNKAMGVYGPNPAAFGHHGWGGSFGFADPQRKLGVAYAMNFMREPESGLDPRFASLVEAVYSSV